MPVKKHGNHGDKDGGDNVTFAAIAENTEDRHGRDRLNDDDAVEDQVRESEGTPQAEIGGWGGAGFGAQAPLLLAGRLPS